MERTILKAVEDAWYVETKGDLDLTEDPDKRDVEVVLAMAASSLRYAVNSGSAQYGAGGVEIDTVTQDEIARRVASALSTLWWGWGN